MRRANWLPLFCLALFFRDCLSFSLLLLLNDPATAFTLRLFGSLQIIENGGFLGEINTGNIPVIPFPISHFTNSI